MKMAKITGFFLPETKETTPSGGASDFNMKKRGPEICLGMLQGGLVPSGTLLG